MFASGAIAEEPRHSNAGLDMAIDNGEVKHAPGADVHAPIGVVRDHRHHQGELMLSYRYTRMWMEGNLIGTDNVSPDTIVTTVPNRFSDVAGEPSTLRVVPTDMSIDMHMFGAMYHVTDRITVTGMLPYVEKETDLITFAGATGTTRLGTFTTGSEGIGDVKASAIVGLFDRESADTQQHLNFLFGISAPTGSITESGRVLTPTGLTPTERLPYVMQLGSGTWDVLPGAVYTHRSGNFSWGAQYHGVIRAQDENDQGYALGDIHQGTVWAQYQWQPWVKSSVRLAAQTQDKIHGIDPNIVAPVQTADPDFYGGEKLDLLFGVTLIGQRGLVCGHRLAAEFGVPVYQDLNGPQLENDWTFMIGWQKTLGDC